MVMLANPVDMPTLIADLEAVYAEPAKCAMQVKCFNAKADGEMMVKSAKAHSGLLVTGHVTKTEYMLIPGWRDRSDRVDVALFESNSYVRVDVRASLAPVDAAAERFFDQQGQAFQDKWRHLDKYIEYSAVLVRESSESDNSKRPTAVAESDHRL